MTLKDAFDLLERIQASKSINTIKQTKCILKHLRPFFDPITLERFITDYEELWSEYVASIAGKHKLTHDRRYLCMALKRAHKKGWISKSFIKSEFQLKESHSHIGRALSDDESKRLLAEAKKYPTPYLQVLLAITMGMRRSEVLQLRPDEIDLEHRVINLDPSRLKTRQPRKVPLPINDFVFPLLEAAVKRCSGKYIFPSVVRWNINWDKPQRDHSYHWNKIRRAAGVSCRFHDLRHTCISNSLGDGMNMTDCVKFFGATPQVIEKIYHHIKPEAVTKFRSGSKKLFEEATPSEAAMESGLIPPVDGLPEAA